MKKSAAVKAARSTSAFPPYKPSKKTPKAPKPIKPEADVEEEPLDFEDDDMATSFLQYWYVESITHPTVLQKVLDD